mmetsp:Transcript_91410/g.293617  ORF Transcript_91410/g.293617 Transcript_91410/m.293617 type:complete len:364 (-) Transcript_91410:115-1206(-)
MGQAAAGREDSTRGAATICCTTRDTVPASTHGVGRGGSGFAGPGGQCCTGRPRGGDCEVMPDQLAPAGVMLANSGGHNERVAVALSLPEASENGDEQGGPNRRHFDPFCKLECGTDRTALASDGFAGREVLSGDRPLKRKLVNIKALREEELHLSDALALLALRMTERRGGATSPTQGASRSPREVASASPCRGSPASSAEWARRLLLSDNALRGVPASLAAEACRTTFQDRGSGQRAIDEEEFRASYVTLLEEANRTAEFRLLEVREELMAACFEEMDCECTGQISLQRFVDFLCSTGEENQLMLEVSPETAERFFVQVAKGAKVLSYDQFKEEITEGCLRVLHRNITLRHSLRKKFRDYWF